MEAVTSHGTNGAVALSATPAVEIDLTPKAVEMAKKAIERRQLVKPGLATAGLRLGVRGGGCSGASYVIEFADKIRERDRVFEFGSVTDPGGALKVVVDPKSLRACAARCSTTK